jgi:hypothetical protein
MRVIWEGREEMGDERRAEEWRKQKEDEGIWTEDEEERWGNVILHVQIFLRFLLNQLKTLF